MALTNYTNGVSSFGMPVLPAYSGFLTTGSVFFVHSGTGEDSPGQGTDPDNPFASIDYAVGRCTAANGDLIVVMEGHAETVSAAGGLDLDVAGITVLGLGNGANRPTITLGTADTADIDVDAANITVANVIIDATAFDSITTAFDVNAANFTLRDCLCVVGDSGGQADAFITTGATTASNGMRIINCIFTSTTTGPVSAIDIVGTPDGVEILGCQFWGTYSGAPINNETGNVATNLRIEGCFLQNTHATALALDLDSACTGYMAHCLIHTANVDPVGAGAAVDSGSLFCYENYASDTVDGSGVLEPAAIT